MKPNFPVILIYNNALDLISGNENLKRGSLLGILNGNSNSIAFDNEGKVWELKLGSDKIKDNFITRFIANTIYNPKIDVIPKWNILREYELSELKSLLKKFVEKDEDIFTQFVEAEILKQYIFEAKTFEDVYRILLKKVFEFDEEIT